MNQYNIYRWKTAASYDKLSEIAPVVYLATDSSIGLVESTLKNARTIASIFGKENELRIKLISIIAE